MIYVFPKLSKINYGFIRFSGGGLGNLLFPFARAILFAKKNGFQMINPTWLTLKLGPIIRNEKDKRFYGNLFNPISESVVGGEKLFLLMVKKCVPESCLIDNELKYVDDVIVTFEGLGNYFDDIIGDYSYIRSVFFDVVKKQHLGGLRFDFTRSISIHVRLGDFNIGNQATDLSWFIKKINEIRDYYRDNIKVFIFSDGTDEELKTLLNINNTERVFFGSSIADMIAMSQSKVLICSKNSTFAWWASYLGRMPIVWPKDTGTKSIYYDNKNKEKFLDYSEKLDDSFLRMIDL